MGRWGDGEIGRWGEKKKTFPLFGKACLPQAGEVKRDLKVRF
jgi:hypothetical protein